MGEPYAGDTHDVNPEDDRRRRLLAAMDLVRTEDILFAIGCSKETLAILRRHGLRQLGTGKQKLYRLSAVATALEAHATSREAGDGREEGVEA